MPFCHLPPHFLQHQQKTLDLSTPQIMGILNLTPDSFSDGGQYNQLDKALSHAEQMIQQGASIIDIGGESTRPNAVAISEDEELQRILTVVQAIHHHFGENIWISVDTSSPKVMVECAKVGANIWNDVRALSRPNAIQTASQLNLPVVLMHMRGEPSNMNTLDHYQHLFDDVLSELQQRIDAAILGGVKKQNLIIDVGFGFAKNHQQNLQWLKNFDRLQQFDLPIMVGVSRKRFIGEVLKQANLPHDVHDRDTLSMLAGVLAVQQGACIIRTHNVAETKAGLSLYQKILNSE